MSVIELMQLSFGRTEIDSMRPTLSLRPKDNHRIDPGSSASG